MSGEGSALKLAREHSEARNFADVNEKNLIQISCAAAELIPTVQYGNVTIGPVVAKVWVPLDFKGFTEDEKASIKLAVRETQSICEEAVAEDRQTVHALTRQSTEGRYQG